MVGAGLPLDLPELTEQYPGVALIPILSDVRGVGLLLKKWLRRQRLPDAIVIEHPGHAGGHLGAARIDEVGDARFGFDQVLEGVFQLFKELGIERERLPLILAGGIHSPAQVRAWLGKGASAVQLGTAFAVTEEGDAHPQFKQVLAQARPEDIVTFMSDAGLPARAVRTPWLEDYLREEARLQSQAKPRARCTLGFDCLVQCGWRDGNPKAGQFCIDTRLAAALRGDVRKGLFFRGAERLPLGTAIRPVRELLQFLLADAEPVAQAA